MAWNPTPEVADCREIARKWKKEQVIILAIDGKGAMQMATFGRTRELCACAGQLGDVAFSAIRSYISAVENEMHNARCEQLDGGCP